MELAAVGIDATRSPRRCAPRKSPSGPVRLALATLLAADAVEMESALEVRHPPNSAKEPDGVGCRKHHPVLQPWTMD